jgi:multiple sugar transport system ATP-binding protein
VAQVVLGNISKNYLARPGEVAAMRDKQESSLSASGKSVGLPVEVSAHQAQTNQVSVLQHIDLTIADGEFMVLVGPSGCGKSTLLRLIAGLETLTAGDIWVGERRVNDLPPKARDIAMVFQSYALYPHMTVYNNLAFGLRRVPLPQISQQSSQQFELPAPLAAFLVAATRSLPKSWRYRSAREQAIDQRVRTIAQMLQIDSLLQRLPKQLSGGQKQRVALGRAMARNPQVFLMDEPLSNLDAKLRAETRAQIVKLQRQLGITTIYVTHDQTEAMTMGDRIAVMQGGQIQQLATPLELYNQPANLFVAEFIGSPPMNFLPMQVVGAKLVHELIQLPISQQWLNSLTDGQMLTLGIRAEHLQPAQPDSAHLPVQVELVEALGNETYVSVSLMNQDQVGLATQKFWQVRVDPELLIRPGEQLHLAFKPDKLHLFDSATGQALTP